MHPSALSRVGVDERDLSGKDEMIAALRREDAAAVVSEALLQLSEPCRMSQVPCAQEGDALHAAVLLEIRHREVVRCGLRIRAVDVQVGEDAHAPQGPQALLKLFAYSRCWTQFNRWM